MSIKRKQKGPLPVFQERWKNLATDDARFVEAVREYRIATGEVSPSVAARAVKAFKQTLK